VSEFDGKGVIVTGGGRGIGLACARLIAQRGGAVAIIGNDVEMLKQARSTLLDDGLDVTIIEADVSKDAQVAGAVAEAEKALGGIDVVINNAAIQPYGTVVTTPPDLWDSVLDVNLRGAYLIAHYALPGMVKRGGGALVNVSSVQGLANQSRVAAYATSKGGLQALTRTIAIDFGRKGIRANTVCPGCIDAPMTWFSARETAPGNEKEMVDQWGQSQPMGRVGRVEEVAEVVAFLASERASFCTGAEFKVDGGLMASLGVALPD
jgi:NAD(P)-dependent dehydrogenase (short-subunit alcohol dehydrogenase family)